MAISQTYQHKKFDLKIEEYSHKKFGSRYYKRKREEMEVKGSKTATTIPIIFPQSVRQTEQQSFSKGKQFNWPFRPWLNQNDKKTNVKKPLKLKPKPTTPTTIKVTTAPDYRQPKNQSELYYKLNNMAIFLNQNNKYTKKLLWLQNYALYQQHQQAFAPHTRQLHQMALQSQQ